MAHPAHHRPLPARPSSFRAWTAALTRGACALLIAGMATCDSLDNIDVEVGGTAVIQAGTIIDELLDTLDVDALQRIDISQELENQGVTKDDVDSVRLLRFALRVEAPQGANLDFLDSVAFYAEAEGQPRVLIAEITAVPPGATEIELDVVADVELKPYAVAPSMTITGEVEGRRPDTDTTVTADVVLDVDVTVPGC